MINRLGELHDAAGVTSAQAAASARGGRRLSGFFRRSGSKGKACTPQSSPTLGQVATTEEPLDKFLARLDEIRRGPLQELETRLKDVRPLHQKALVVTSPAAETDALARVEACADSACKAATETKDALQLLASEVEECENSTERRLRKQSFSGVSVLFRNALNTYYQAQQGFRGEMEAKVKRQLRVAFPEADDLTVDAVAAGQRSAASAIQGSLLLQSGVDKLSIDLAIQSMEAKCNELEELATAAKELQERFAHVEIQIFQQGEIIDNIAHHVDATRTRTEATNRALQQAHAAQSACCWRWCTIILVLVLILVVGIVLLKTRTGKKSLQALRGLVQFGVDGAFESRFRRWCCDN